MPVILTLGLITAAGVGALGLVRRFSDRHRSRREITRRPALGPSSVEGDHVRVVGTVRALDQTLIAPISGRTCVAYLASAMVDGGQPRADRGPVNHRPASSQCVPFLVDTGGPEVVLVDGECARFDVPTIKLTPADADRKVQFLASHGFPAAEAREAGFTEIVIEPGMTIAVVGVMMRDVAHAPPSGEVAFRGGPSPTIRITGSREHPLAIAEGKVVLALK
jgi:hypothetical protein